MICGFSLGIKLAGARKGGIGMAAAMANPCALLLLLVSLTGQYALAAESVAETDVFDDIPLDIAGTRLEQRLTEVPAFLSCSIFANQLWVSRVLHYISEMSWTRGHAVEDITGLALRRTNKLRLEQWQGQREFLIDNVGDELADYDQHNVFERRLFARLQLGLQS